ncbi:MAG TPA: 5'/3'-nucleotidase SurE [Firmicutes bacterium]|nr:5'/3'-nucleotidase SurE [Bacillota bacterium]
MKILLTNDDGIRAKGLHSLASSLTRRSEFEVYVVAPDRERSACGHGITLHEPIYVEEVKFDVPGVKGAWAISGTPADCTKIGIEVLVKGKPDMVLSGVNRGPNLGTDILYSGTVSGAMEGCVHGIPSIAVSLADFSSDEFDFAAEVGAKLALLLRDVDMSPNLFNVNVPALPPSEIRGVAVTRMGQTLYRDRFEGQIDQSGRNCFWLTGDLIATENADDTDVKAVEKGFVSITPLHLNLTDGPLISIISVWPLDQLLL